MQAKSRRCSNCRKKVATEDALISHLKAFCNYDCLKEFGVKNAEKITDKRRKEKRQEDRKTKEKLKTKSQWMKEAQAAVNAYIRWRDKDKTCISCNRRLQSEALGGGFDAGHFLSRGAHPHKRFRTDNIHGQCKHCNRYKSGNVENFRIGIVWRYGQDYLDRIEAPWDSPDMTIEYLKRIKSVFTRKLKLKSNNSFGKNH